MRCISCGNSVSVPYDPRHEKEAWEIWPAGCPKCGDKAVDMWIRDVWWMTLDWSTMRHTYMVLRKAAPELAKRIYNEANWSKGKGVFVK